jgi:hypothetical protein
MSRMMGKIGEDMPNARAAAGVCEDALSTEPSSDTSDATFVMVPGIGNILRTVRPARSPRERCSIPDGTRCPCHLRWCGSTY